MFRAIFHLNCAEIASKLSLSDIIRRVLHILYIIFARQSTKKMFNLAFISIFT